ncbi:hypothetical protein GCM10008018_36100 [Paenibacillus marchantiophytorum]|uniref:Zinc ribbon domain-containing protein n=1 Tax=Paenibacillus marchantiophytorum TaxID=1619310 RepID=A0ABQ1ETN2_9BACL|nr:hypothetical protein [Paenibacillus marchantiophytorum]GFZ86841.1 hypothetical protein GCM10008018_36100 [Paenibacillus marchantiophytorum]
MAKIIVHTCPNCGANLPIDINQICEFCGTAYIPKNLAALAKMDSQTKHNYITSYKEKLEDNKGNIPLAVSLAMCHIDAQNYEFSFDILKKLAENNCTDPNVFYYMALAMLEGKKPRVLHMDKVRKVESYLNSAQVLSSGTGLYYIMQAVIKRDYYEYYLFNMHQGGSSKLLLEKANNFQLDVEEIHQILKIVKLDESDRSYFDSVLAI